MCGTRRSGAFVVARGRVAAKSWKDREGFMYGDTHVEGEGPDAGRRFRVWFKNENHVLWRGEQP